VTKTAFIPDPRLTVSEAVNVHAALVAYMETATQHGDAVIASALEKLVQAAQVVHRQNPAALDAAEKEYLMHRRFRDESRRSR
jgi:hypothetical protein